MSPLARVSTRGALARWLLEPERPGLGLDLRLGAFSVARLAERRGRPELDLCATAPIPPGAVVFERAEPNILDRDALKAAVSSVLTRTGATEARRIALTLPDYLSRLAVIELPERPRSTEETAELLKFRVGKSIPIDPERARLAFEEIPGKSPAYLTGVLHEEVVSQYEDFLEEMGFHVGLVMPASLGLLRILVPLAASYLAPESDYFFVNVEREYFTVALIQDRERLTLIRTLGLREGGSGEPALVSEEDLVQDIIPTAIYYRERLGGRSLHRVYVRSLRPDLPRLREILEEQFEAPSEPFSLSGAIEPAKDLQLDAALADAAGAAAGAALGRVA